MFYNFFFSLYFLFFFVFFFFFSSRRRHTRSLRDWSSDVCSSDLSFLPSYLFAMKFATWTCGFGLVKRSVVNQYIVHFIIPHSSIINIENIRRSEERRVGKSVDLGGRRIIKKKKTKRKRSKYEK